MAEVLLRDVSRAGHELGRANLTGLPGRLPLRDLLRARIRSDVATYNADPGPVYVGLVQPEDAIRHRDGHRMRRPRVLDADRFVLAAEQAIEVGLLRFQVADRLLDDLDEEVDLERTDEVLVVLDRPVIARDPD